MRLCLPILALLALAGCANTPRSTPPSMPPVALLAGTRIDAVQLKPVDLASTAPTDSALLTVDSWLDDYFTVWRTYNDKLRQAALQQHPEWVSLLESRRQIDAEDEALARYVFHYHLRLGTGGIYWANGNWKQFVMPCSCGRIGRINTPEWEKHFRSVSAVRDSFRPNDPAAFWSEYRAAIKGTEEALKPELEAELARLKPGFFRFMREPAQPHSGH